jgi:hypothetical protein
MPGFARGTRGFGRLPGGVNMDDCTTCHVLDNGGTLAAPLSRKDYQPCANAGCHQAEYLVREPKICGICHGTAAPWATVASRPGLEWLGAMSHASQVARGSPGRNGPWLAMTGDPRPGGDAP